MSHNWVMAVNEVEVADVCCGLKDYEKRDEREMREKCVNSCVENRK